MNLRKNIVKRYFCQLLSVSTSDKGELGMGLITYPSYNKTQFGKNVSKVQVKPLTVGAYPGFCKIILFATPSFLDVVTRSTALVPIYIPGNKKAV